MTTIKLPDGRTADMTEPQVRELHRLAVEHPGSVWHMANCGCCACLHPDGDTARGWIVGADGTSEYHEEAHA